MLILAVCAAATMTKEIFSLTKENILFDKVKIPSLMLIQFVCAAATMTKEIFPLTKDMFSLTKKKYSL